MDKLFLSLAAAGALALYWYLKEKRTQHIVIRSTPMVSDITVKRLTHNKLLVTLISKFDFKANMINLDFITREKSGTNQVEIVINYNVGNKEEFQKVSSIYTIPNNIKKYNFFCVNASRTFSLE